MSLSINMHNYQRRLPNLSHSWCNPPNNLKWSIPNRRSNLNNGRINHKYTPPTNRDISAVHPQQIA